VTEQDVWVKLLKRGDVIPTAFWNRIETGSTVGGVPDIYVVKKSSPVWIESKIFRSNRMKMRPLQPGWHRRHAKCGGRSEIMGYHEAAGLTRLLLYRGSKIEELMAAGVAYTSSPTKRARAELIKSVEVLADLVLPFPICFTTLDKYLFGD
jgi:hypothetical protein